jgi:predicted ribosomally synthesized peptide with nif11-like leader
MSLDNVGRFIDALSTDTALQQKLGAVRDPAEMARLAVQAGSERGIRFTEKEFLATIDRHRAAGSGQLSDDELEGVAGGMKVAAQSSGLSPSQQARQDWFAQLLEKLEPSKPPYPG